MCCVISPPGYGNVGRNAPEQHTETTNKMGEHFGYTESQLKQLPPGANLGLQCGNPQTYAQLKEGESVLDLGSGMYIIYSE